MKQCWKIIELELISKEIIYEAKLGQKNREKQE